MWARASRRTDFLVNEIQKDGTVLHLRKCNIELPKEAKEVKEVKEAKKEKEACVSGSSLWTLILTHC